MGSVFMNTVDALHLRLFKTGVTQKDAKVYVDNGELITEGQKEKYFIRARMHLPLDRVKVNAITLKKNKVMEVCIPIVEQQEKR